ncbi:hypothetical protein T4E_10106 [Trichinella pseudospiralis]|uniref:Uncharacterized protein n=1 Tax=Trichinella pseudospiralis TaxID=6337 RepID=A0A0V0YG62_TRIPS|nr:hypothetical protein T4E_10106 [Trichinella pseudospiralis]
MDSKIRLLAAMRTWGMDGTFKLVVQWYQQLFLPSMLLWQVSWGASSLLFIATVLAVNLNPHPALIPAIHGYFTNTQLHGCSLHYPQAVHRKVGELELKTRYRTEEETKREIKILLATAFLPVPHVGTGDSLLEAADRGRHEADRGRHEAELWNEDIRYMRFPKGPNSVSLG